MTNRSGRTRRSLATLVTLVVALASTSPLAAEPALADTPDELQSEIDRSLKTYNDSTARIHDLQAQIDDSQAQIDDVQAKLPAQRERADDASRAMYKTQESSSSIVGLLLSSSSVSEFITTYTYVNSAQRGNAEQTRRLVEMERSLEGSRQSLVDAQSQEQTQQQAAKNAMGEAQAKLDDLNRQIAAQAAAEAAAQAAAQQQQAAQSAQAQQQAAQSAQAAQQTSQPAATSPSSPQSPSSSHDSVPDTGGTWQYGLASAYGDASDGTLGGTTASGVILTLDTMGVAVPQSQSHLLGRTVEITYRDKTVRAKVIDTGGFAGYGRALDLCAGVWRAFGFSSSNDWGVQLVHYRFV